MSCRDIDHLLGLAPHELTAHEHGRLARHIDACRTCHSQHLDRLATERTLAEASARIPVQGAARTVALLQQPRTRLLVRLARWSSTIHTLARALAPPALGIAFLLLGVWLLDHVRPNAASNSATLTPQTNVSPGGEAGARVWLLRAAPLPQALLQSDVHFEVHVGYQLTGVRSALLSLRIADVPSGQSRYFSPPQLVSAEQDRAVVEFVLDSDRAQALFGSGPVQLEAVLRDATAGGAHAVLAHELFTAARYELR